MASRLRVVKLSKRFGSTQALDDASLTIAPGEVHALLGANGAGKSTLIRIVAGSIKPDSGQVLLDEEPLDLSSPAQAQALGIGVIHQQLSVMPSLTVAENFMLKRTGATRPRSLFPSRREPRRTAARVIGQFTEAIDPDVLVERLSFSQRQLVEIGIAVSSNVRLLVMDEPTSGLSAKEQEALFEAILRLTDSGVSILYVSHKMNEVYRICDRITVIREGRNVAEFARTSLDREAVVEAIVGTRMLDVEAAEHVVPPAGERQRGSLVVRDLQTARVENISFDVVRGEILGLYGVVGSGVSEIAEALCGARHSAGVVRLDGRLLRRRSPASARREGIALVPADHRNRGLVAFLSVRENVLMGRGTWRRDFIRRLPPVLRRQVADAVASVQVKCRDLAQPVSELSGGNQQKVVFARWILEHPDVLVLEDPTQGIDVGAKVDMLAAIRRERDRGAAIVFISSEAMEIVAIADRALIVRDGAVVGELAGDQLEEKRIVALAAAS